MSAVTLIRKYGNEKNGAGKYFPVCTRSGSSFGLCYVYRQCGGSSRQQFQFFFELVSGRDFIPR